MALNNGKLNPLEYFNLRRVDYPCPHFEYITITDHRSDLVKFINEWIAYNLNNRYYVEKGISLDSENHYINTTVVGFESKKELSYFTIACPIFHKR